VLILLPLLVANIVYCAVSLKGDYTRQRPGMAALGAVSLLSAIIATVLIGYQVSLADM
jgi:hypothetical protein